jgi:hypothetical protein
MEDQAELLLWIALTNEEEECKMPLVDLVKLGFLGFAVAVILLSFVLLQKLMNSSEFEGENLLIRCKQIHRFMLMSIAVIFIGMTWELASRMIQPQVNVRFDVSPKDNEAMLAIKAGKKKVDISKDEEVQMQDGDEVSLDLVELDRKIREMKGEIERHAGASNQLNILKQQRASEEFDAAKGEAGI